MSFSASRYFGMIKIAVRQRMNYRFDFIMTFVASMMYSILYYMLWKAIYFYTTEPVMPWNQLITYIMVGQAVNMSRWSPADRSVVYGTAARIRDGDVALDLIRPVDYQVQKFLEAAGFFMVEILWVNIPMLVLFVVMLGINPPQDIYTAIGFLASLIVGFVVAFSINSIVIMITFWTTNAQGLQVAKKAIIDLLAGTLVPFEFFPLWFKDVVMHLPFKGMAYLPLSIYTGKIAGVEIITALLEQLVWAVVMILVSRFIWLRINRRLMVFGG